MSGQTTTSADGTTIAYEVEGEGPPLVLVGGAFNTRRSAAGLASLLASDHTTCRFDRRGRGQSGDTQPHDVAREVEDLAAVIERLGGSAAVYGHSSGAILALRAAAAGLPISAVVAYEPPYGDGTSTEPDPTLEHVEQALADGRRREAARTFLEGAGAPAGWLDSLDDEGWSPFEALAHTLPYDLRITGDGGPHAELSQIRVPTTVVVGGASPDWFADAAGAVAELVPGAEVVVLEGADHAVPDDLAASVVRSSLRR